MPAVTRDADLEAVTDTRSSAGSEARRRDVLALNTTFAGIAVFCLPGATVYGLATSAKPATAFQALAGAVIICGMHALVGGIIGFLFAIPRSRQSDIRPQPADTAAIGAVAQAPHGRQSDYAANTNLEQISDWLTKI